MSIIYVEPLCGIFIIIVKIIILIIIGKYERIKTAEK